MRDINKSKEYFDSFIEQEMETVDFYESNLIKGMVKEERIMPVKDALLQTKLGIILAKYSRGDAMSEIKQEFISIIDLFLESWNRDSYEDNLKIASLSYLFDVDNETINKIAEKLKERPYYDPLISYILYGYYDTDIKNNISFPVLYIKLGELIKSKDVNILLDYINGWYNDHNDSPWYDAHKSKKVAIYYGYWCLEAAALVKRLNLDDSILKSNKYYPCDMVNL